MTIYYKLTNLEGMSGVVPEVSDGCIPTQWGEGVTNKIKQGYISPEESLCSNAWLHVYKCPYVAIFVDYWHAGYADDGPKACKVWECDIAGTTRVEDVKVGATIVRSLREIPSPKRLTIAQLDWLFYRFQEVLEKTMGYVLHSFRQPAEGLWKTKWTRTQDFFCCYKRQLGPRIKQLYLEALEQ